jgi:hypothetical protein
VTQVVLTSEDGEVVTGTLRDDGTSWSRTCHCGRRPGYTATVTAAGLGAERVIGETSFTTMAACAGRASRPRPAAGTDPPTLWRCSR